jgi:hypothetical protein
MRHFDLWQVQRLPSVLPGIDATYVDGRAFGYDANGYHPPIIPDQPCKAAECDAPRPSATMPGMKLRFTIRDLFWLTLVVAFLIYYARYTKLESEYSRLKIECDGCKKSLDQLVGVIPDNAKLRARIYVLEHPKTLPAEPAAPQ